jgi:hypothetical protein
MPLACVVPSGDFYFLKTRWNLGANGKKKLYKNILNLSFVLPMSNSEVTQRNPTDPEDDSIQYFHSAYCSIPFQPLMAYVSQPKQLAAI